LGKPYVSRKQTWHFVWKEVIYNNQKKIGSKQNELKEVNKQGQYTKCAALLVGCALIVTDDGLCLRQSTNLCKDCRVPSGVHVENPEQECLHCKNEELQPIGATSIAYKLTNRDKRVINKAGGADHSSIEYGYSPPVIGNYEKTRAE
jgi:hypothetical protein